jgi:hypothetical protein
MEENRKTLLLTLALVFIGMLLLTSVFAAKEQTGGTPQTNSQVVQTYKSYGNHNQNYNNIYETTSKAQIRPVRYTYSNNYNHKGVYYTGIYQSDNTRTVDTSIKYTQFGTEKTKKDFIGTYVKQYSVSVTNRGETGRYFTVTFNLEDKYGYDQGQSITQYLKAGENKKFVYKDIQFERNEILNWNYKITPENY